MSYTYVLLTVSPRCYEEIADKLRVAGYDQAFDDDGTIDLHGLALPRPEPDAMPREVEARTMTRDEAEKLGADNGHDLLSPTPRCHRVGLPSLTNPISWLSGFPSGEPESIPFGMGPGDLMSSRPSRGSASATLDRPVRSHPDKEGTGHQKDPVPRCAGSRFTIAGVPNRAPLLYHF